MVRWFMVSCLAGWAFLSGCDLLGEGQPRCSGDRSYPLCADSSTVHRCLGTEFLEQERCAPGTFCLAGEYGPDSPWAACVQEGTEVCDMDLHVPFCQDDDLLWVCTGSGYTVQVSCQLEVAGYVCMESPVRAACTPPDAIPCDPETYEPGCHGQSPEYCDWQFGFVAARDACEEPLVCRVGGEGPVCAAADSDPCDYLDYLPTCVGESILACDPFDAFTEERPCEPDELCLESPVWPGARCYPSSAVRCERDSFVSRCQDGRRVVCDSFGVEEHLDCSAEEQCQTSAGGGFCVESGAELCDPKSYLPSCDGQEPLVCDKNTGYTDHLPQCPAPLVCKSGSYGPRCVDSDSQICQADDYWCDGSRMVVCLNGLTEGLPCAEGLICVEDEFSLWVPMSCVDPDAPACEVSQPVVCDGQTGTRCAGGYQTDFDCQAGNMCISDGGRWFCLPDDAPACDPDSFIDGCRDTEVHLCWLPGLEFSWTCSPGYVCLEGAAGPECALPPDSPDCDPLVFLEHCQDNIRVSCLAEGKVIYRPCSEGYQCQEMWNGLNCLEP